MSDYAAQKKWKSTKQTERSSPDQKKKSEFAN